METVSLSPIVQGNKWTQLITVTRQDHDFTNPMVEVGCRIRETPQYKNYYDFSPGISFASGETGRFTITLEVLGNESASFSPGNWQGDLWVYQSGNNFGPYTPISFTLSVLASITPPAI